MLVDEPNSLERESFLVSSFWALCPPQNQPSAYEMRTLHLVPVGVDEADSPCLSLTAVSRGRSSDLNRRQFSPQGTPSVSGYISSLPQ